MSKVLIIGAGGVGTVVAHKVAKNEIFTDIMLASRTKSKCDQIAAAVVVEGEEPGDASGGRTAGPIIKAIFEKYKEQYLDKSGASIH